MHKNIYKKRIILIDLDGVLNNYDGNFQENYIPEIKDGALEFLQALAEDYCLKIFTSRPEFLVKIWLQSNKIDSYISAITNTKEPAFLYIDDRCLCFAGDYKSTLEEIKLFTPWHAKQ